MHARRIILAAAALAMISIACGTPARRPLPSRNEGRDTARNVVTYFVPRGAKLRIDAAAPGNCPF